MTAATRSQAFLRWALLAALLAMALALVASSWAAWSSVEQASQTVSRGEAEAFLHSLRRHLEGRRRPWTTEDVASFLEQEAEAGLRYVALLGPRGGVVAEAGEAIPAVVPPGPDEPRPRGLELLDLGERVRVFAGGEGPPERGRRRGGRRERWPRRFEPPPGDEPPPPRGARRPGGPPPDRGPIAILEFEPLVARELARQSTRALGLGGAGAVALAGVALLLVSLLRQRERDLERLAEQERLSSLGEMSAVLAHEIKNPLASLKGHAQLLAERLPRDSREREGADRVVGEARRLEELARRLLDFVRAGRAELSDVDPGGLLRACAAEADGDRVRVSAEGAPPSWPLDAVRLRQALGNLLENAVQASPEGEPVEASVHATGGRLVFTVRDHGPGLPAGEGERLFEPFRTTKTTGTGLGLAVARRVAELHGGTIRATDHPEGGAIFRLTIPRQRRP